MVELNKNIELRLLNALLVGWQHYRGNGGRFLRDSCDEVDVRSRAIARALHPLEKRGSRGRKSAR